MYSYRIRILPLGENYISGLTHTPVIWGLSPETVEGDLIEVSLPVVNTLISFVPSLYSNKICRKSYQTSTTKKKTCKSCEQRQSWDESAPHNLCTPAKGLRDTFCVVVLICNRTLCNRPYSSQHSNVDLCGGLSCHILKACDSEPFFHRFDHVNHTVSIFVETWLANIMNSKWQQ